MKASAVFVPAKLAVTLLDCWWWLPGRCYAVAKEF